jgi:hypothetical protein
MSKVELCMVAAAQRLCFRVLGQNILCTYTCMLLYYLDSLVFQVFHVALVFIEASCAL